MSAVISSTPYSVRSTSAPLAANWDRKPLQIGLTSGWVPEASAVVIASKLVPNLVLTRLIRMSGWLASNASIILIVAASSWVLWPSQKSSVTTSWARRPLVNSGRERHGGGERYREGHGQTPP